MGLSSSSSTTKTTPTYEPQLLGANDKLSGAYDTTSPKIQNVTDQVTGMLPGMLNNFKNGDPALNAASGYITSTLGHGPGENPYLQGILDRSNGEIANQTSAHLGTRGLTGGTAMEDIMSRNIAANDSNLRYQDYNKQQDLQAQAAGMAPGVSAAKTASIAPILGVAQTAGDPLKAAVGYAGATGGLLGPYTNSTTKTQGSIFQMLMQGASNAAAAYAGGG